MPETVVIACPSCLARFRIAAETPSGGRFVCKTCSHSFSRTEAEATQSPIVPIAPSAPKVAPKPAQSQPPKPRPVAKPAPVARNDDDIPVAPVARPRPATPVKPPVRKPVAADDDFEPVRPKPKPRPRRETPPEDFDDFDEDVKPVRRRRPAKASKRQPKSKLPYYIGGGVAALLVAVAVVLVVGGNSGGQISLGGDTSNGGGAPFVGGESNGVTLLPPNPEVMELLEANLYEKPRIEVWQNDRIATPRTIQDDTLRSLFPSSDTHFVAHLADSKGGYGYEVIRLKQPVDVGKLLASKSPSMTTVNGIKIYGFRNAKSWRQWTEMLAYWQPNPRVIAVRELGEGWQKVPETWFPTMKPTLDPRWRRAFEFVSGYGECVVSERYNGLNVKDCVVGTAKRDDGTLTAVLFPDSGKRSEWSSLLEKELKYMTAEQDTTPGRREFMNAIGGTKRWGQGDVLFVFKPK